MSPKFCCQVYPDEMVRGQLKRPAGQDRPPIVMTYQKTDQFLANRARPALKCKADDARRGIPHRGEHCQAAKRAPANIEGHSAAAKFGQSRRLSLYLSRRAHKKAPAIPVPGKDGAAEAE